VGLPILRQHRDRQTLGVLHIPKCGGSAVRSALARLDGCYAGPLYYDEAHFGEPDLSESLLPSRRAEVASRQQLRPVVARSRLVIGHYSSRSLVAAGAKQLATQIREPRSRLLSLYRYWQGQTPDERQPWGLWGSRLVATADRPLGAFLANPALWPAVDNAMVRQVCQTGSRLLRSAPREPRQLRIVEWASQSQAFVERIYSLFGVSDVPSVQHENVTEVREDRQSIGPAERAELDRLTAGDMSLVGRLVRRGLLEPRSPDQLDREFAETADRLGFDLPA
jgi:hypothetical protein